MPTLFVINGDPSAFGEASLLFAGGKFSNMAHLEGNELPTRNDLSFTGQVRVRFLARTAGQVCLSPCETSPFALG